MEDTLDSRLVALLADRDEAAIYEGLKPLSGRLARLFGQGDEAKLALRLPQFCHDYIAQIPQLAAEIMNVAGSLELKTLIEAHLTLSIRYLSSACDEIEQSGDKVGLEQFLILLQGAYMFSRMLEELDDKVQVFVGAPLSHMNMMDANLVVHEIIGESFANRLDKVVLSLIKQSQVSKIVIEAGLNQETIAGYAKAHKSLTGREVQNLAAAYDLDMASRLA